MVEAVAAAKGRVRGLAAGKRRILIGIVGAPGVGKSTFAEMLVDALAPEAICVGMDGFHLSNAQLHRLGRRDAKGALDTFDAAGFLNLIARLESGMEEQVYAPEFRREIDEPIAAAIRIPREKPVVIVEGNYLLVDQAPWNEIAKYLTECWYLETDESTRLERLQARHREFGDPPILAREKAYGNDQRNANLIKRGKPAADLLIEL